MNPLTDEIQQKDSIVELKDRKSFKNTNVLEQKEELGNSEYLTNLVTKIIQYPRKNSKVLIGFTFLNFIGGILFILRILINDSFSLPITEYARLIAWFINELVPFLTTIIWIRRKVELSVEPKFYKIEAIISKLPKIIVLELILYIPMIGYSCVYYWLPIDEITLGSSLDILSYFFMSVYSIIFFISHLVIHLSIFDMICGFQGCVDESDEILNNLYLYQINTKKTKENHEHSVDYFISSYIDLKNELDKEITDNWRNFYSINIFFTLLNDTCRMFSLLIAADGIIGSNGNDNLQTLGAVWYVIGNVIWLTVIFSNIISLTYVFMVFSKRCRNCQEGSILHFSSLSRQNVLYFLEKCLYKAPIWTNEVYKDVLRLSYRNVLFFYRSFMVALASILVRFALSQT